MKTLFFILNLVILTKTGATNYYLAINGNDTNIGTSIVSPWKTIGKLNSATLVAGDSIFFRCGDVFRGEIALNSSGNQFQQIVFTSYGNGSKPIISGAVLVNNWQAANGIYQSTVADSVGNFFVSDEEQTLARYPDNGQYLTLDSSSLSYLKDASLGGLNPNLIEGNICAHTAQWCWEKATISSFSNNKINFGTNMQITAIPNFSYFLYNSLNHLDAENEWYYDDVSQILYYKSTGNLDPATLTCEASIYENGLIFSNNVSYVSIQNLAFEKQLNAGILISSNTNRRIQISNCEFRNQYNHGVNDKGRLNEISNSTFQEIDGIAILVDQTGFKSSIHHNTFRNIGQYRNGGVGGQINLSAITLAFVDSCYIHHNDIDTVGYCGIAADGGYHIVERNIIKHAMRIVNDGAALKSFGGQSHHIIFRNNFVSQSGGTLEETYNNVFITPAIYFDFNVNNCLIENNTIYDHDQKGIFQNAGTNNNTIKGNVIYGTNYGIDLNGSHLMPTTINNMTIKNNVIFALNDQAYVYRQVDYSNTFEPGILDSNYLFQPYNANKIAIRIENNTPSDMSFEDWQSAGNDLHSKQSFVSWVSGQNESQLFMNQTDENMVVDLQNIKYLDLDSNLVCGSIELSPYSSKLLIALSEFCTNSIDENIFKSETIVYPNPCSDFLTINSEEQILEVKIFDVNGQLILGHNVASKNVNIVVDQLTSGIYILNIDRKNDKEIVRFVKL